jgi:hypothetical protein
MTRFLFIFFVVLSLARSESVPNQLSPEEAKGGWELLWDGKTSAGWRSAYEPSFPSHGWEIKDGVLSVLPTGKPGSSGGDLITEKKFANFELVVDFRVTAGANSGIKYFVDAEVNQGREGAQLGLEYQIIDDLRHPDAKAGKNGDRSLASLYDLYPASSAKKPHAVGEWNTARIVVQGAHVEHWLNGEKVLEYTRFTDAFRNAVKESKYQRWPRFGELKEGHILLQEHGDAVSFRNLKIRLLPGVEQK